MDPSLKQQIVERLQQSNNILITVGNSPSVDELASAIGLTLLLNKMNKHATTVFSGAIPSTIEFLQPEKTIETNTNSLRDFIIALDKSKADKLRYKVEDDVVRIFITPYRTSLSQDDLDFSQGDFNVEAVVAIGVSKKEELDQAITAHGRILHDAVVMSITKAGMTPGDLGSINLHDDQASSFCEIILNIGDSVQTGLLDGQIATSFLTGIVAETDRFKNAKTTPKVLSLSAQLMAAGANQQLIAEKLEAPVDIPQIAPSVESQDVNTAQDGELNIDHEEVDGSEIHIDEHGNMDIKQDIAEEQSIVSEDKKLPEVANDQPVDEDQKFPEIRHEKHLMDPDKNDSQAEPADLLGGYSEPPSMSGSLNATALNNVPSPSTDPFSTAQQQTAPMLSHQAVLEPSATDQPVSDSTMQSAPPLTTSAPSPQATEQPRDTDLPETSTTETPKAPDSLSDLEKSLKSPHAEATNLTGGAVDGSVQQQSPPIELADDYSSKVDSARDAVSKATGLSSSAPEPIIALGAQPLGDPLSVPAQTAPEQTAIQQSDQANNQQQDPNSLASILANSNIQDASSTTASSTVPAPNQTPTPSVTPQVTDPTAPPPVPPPMMPQFYDSDGQHSNPFLNPDDKKS